MRTDQPDEPAPLDLSQWQADAPARSAIEPLRILLHGLAYGRWHADRQAPVAGWETPATGLFWGVTALGFLNGAGWRQLIESQYGSIFGGGVPALALKALVVLVGLVLGGMIVTAARRERLHLAAPVAAYAGMCAGIVIACKSWEPGAAWFGGLVALPPLTAWLGLVLGSLAGQSREHLTWLQRQGLLLGATFLALTVAYLAAPATVPQRILGDAREHSPMGSVFYGIERLRVWDTSLQDTAGLSSSDPKVLDRAVRLLMQKKRDPRRLWELLQPVLEHQDKAVRQAACDALVASPHRTVAAEVLARAMVTMRECEALVALEKIAPGQVPRALELLRSGGSDDTPAARRQVVPGAKQDSPGVNPWDYDDTMAALSLIVFGTDEASVPAVIELLHDARRDIRVGACRGLQLAKDARAVPALIDATRDREPLVREAALVALAELGDRRALPVLVEALKTGDRSMATTMVRGLGELKDPEAASAILAYVPRAQQSEMYEVELTLERMGDSTYPALVRAAHSPSPQVRELVVTLLSGADYPGAAAAVAKAGSIRDDSFRRRLIEKRRWEADDKEMAGILFEAILHGGPDIRAYAEKEFVDYCARGHSEALEMGLAHPAPAVHLVGLRALADRRGHVEIEKVKPLAHHANPRTRAAAIEAMHEAFHEHALTIVVKALRHDADATVRAAAARALGKSHTGYPISPFEAEDELTAALRKDKSPAVRAAVAKELAMYRSEAVDDALIKAATSDKDAAVRKAAARALTRHTTPQALRFLEKARQKELQRARQQLNQ